MAYLDNPAGRLHNVLESLLANPGRQAPIRGALADLLTVEADDDAELLRRLASILELPFQIRREVEQLPVNEGLLDNLPSVEQALSSLSLQARIDRWTGKISDVAMRELEICSSQLHGYRPQGFVPGEKLTDLREQIVTLTSEVVESSDVPTELREFLLDHLYKMQRAVDTYMIVGLDGLREALEGMLGAYMLNPTVKKQMGRWKKLAKKFGHVVGSILLILQLANTGTALVDRHFPELLSNDQQTEQIVDDEDVVEGEIIPDEGDTPES